MKSLKQPSKRAPQSVAPPPPPVSLQHDLFEITDGRVNTEFRVFTNVFDLWDLLPKFDVWGHAKRYHTEVEIQDRVRKVPVRHKIHRDHLLSEQDSFVDLELHIEPALIQRKVREWVTTVGPDGKKKRKRIYLRDEKGNYTYAPAFVYPGLREDKLHECLTFLLSHGQGDFTPEKTGVNFSIKQVQSELKRTGSSLSLDEIKEGLEVLSRARCEVYGLDVDGKPRNVLGSNFLPALIMVDRSTYEARLAAGEETHCYAQFHMLMTMGIRANLFRLSNYETHQRLDNLFSRYLHRVLRITFLNATKKGHPFRLSTNQAMAEFGRQITRTDNTRQIMLTGIKDLMSQRVIEHFVEEEPETDPSDKRRILDRTFLLYPTDEFVDEMIASNTRHKRNRELYSEYTQVAASAQKARKLTAEQDQIRKELLEWRISSRIALELIDEHPEDILKRCLKETRTRFHAGELKNPSGFIIKALAEGYFLQLEADDDRSAGSDEEQRALLEPNEDFIQNMPMELQNRVFREWALWKKSTRMAFNRYGVASPHIREILEIDN